jgi:hypothetical protein
MKKSWGRQEKVHLTMKAYILVPKYKHSQDIPAFRQYYVN